MLIQGNGARMIFARRSDDSRLLPLVTTDPTAIRGEHLNLTRMYFSLDFKTVEMTLGS